MEQPKSNIPKINAAVDQSLGLSADVIHRKALSLMADESQKAQVLDFGAGRGRLLDSLRNLGYTHLAGADLMPKPVGVDQNVGWFQSDLNASLPIQEPSFDLILAVEVIEHLENPRQAAREWARLLKPSGKVILTTPNCNSLRSLIALAFKGHFVSFLEKDYPAHITALTGTDLFRILTECGFRNIEFHYTDDGLIPAAAGLRWQKLSKKLFRGKWFSDNVLVRAQK